MTPKLFVILTLIAISIAGCGESRVDNSGGNPTSPTPSTALNLSGTWAGTGTYFTGPGTLTWTITQNGNNITGPIRVAATSGSITINGTSQGTLTGTTLSATWTIPTGGVTGFPNCSGTFNVNASDVTTNRIAGTYAGISACLGEVSSGTFTITK
jgi:hypothetical protein